MRANEGFRDDPERASGRGLGEPPSVERDVTSTSVPNADAAQATESPAVPHFRDLEPAECEEILARNNVGRLAYAFHNRIDIEPVHYVFDEGWLYGRTSLSAKLDVLRHSRWVAFEVDEIDSLFDWRSVVAHGAFYVISPEGAPLDRRAWDRAVTLLRRLVPETGTADDPVPHRNVLFRIHIDGLTGREATPGTT